MPARPAKNQPPLITSARWSKSLDTEARSVRYLITMAFRVVSFVAGCFAPNPWNWVLFAAAAVLPAVAVVLANAIDQRTQPGPPLEETAAHLALTPGVVVLGAVVEHGEETA